MAAEAAVAAVAVPAAGGRRRAVSRRVVVCRDGRRRVTKSRDVPWCERAESPKCNSPGSPSLPREGCKALLRGNERGLGKHPQTNMSPERAKSSAWPSFESRPFRACRIFPPCPRDALLRRCPWAFTWPGLRPSAPLNRTLALRPSFVIEYLAFSPTSTLRPRHRHLRLDGLYPSPTRSTPSALSRCAAAGA